MAWEDYQHQIAELFRKVSGASVAEDTHRPGRNNANRQVDVLVEMNINIELRVGIQVSLPVVIMVDAKEHKDPVDVPQVAIVNDIRDDIGANLAIIAAPKGFTEGAKIRASSLPILLLAAPSDLLVLLADLEIPWGCDCLIPCSDEAVVEWNSTITEGVYRGTCDTCNKIHILCPDCGRNFAITDHELDKALECPGKCGRHYHASSNPERVVSSYDKLDSMIMESCKENKTQMITKGKVEKLIHQTKWQHWPNEDPVKRLVELGIVIWKGDRLLLTQKGSDAFEDHIRDAVQPTRDGTLPDIDKFFNSNEPWQGD